jgi:hypothetical protein
MQVERIKLENIKQQDHLVVLEGMEVGESLFFEDERKAQSIRVLSYYLIKTRKLERKYVFRKMDRGWRIIRVH